MLVFFNDICLILFIALWYLGWLHVHYCRFRRSTGACFLYQSCTVYSSVHGILAYMYGVQQCTCIHSILAYMYGVQQCTCTCTWHFGILHLYTDCFLYCYGPPLFIYMYPASTSTCTCSYPWLQENMTNLIVL